MTEVLGNRTMRKEQSIVISVFLEAGIMNAQVAGLDQVPSTLNPPQEN
jgi:hypothetical protein